MAINILIIWFMLCLLGFHLIKYRSDGHKIILDFWLIAEHGDMITKFLLWFGAFFILPISIFFSIRKILNK